MRCRLCRWPTTIWQRDLVSGLCGECKYIQRAMPGIDRAAATKQALYAHAARLLSRGASPQTVQSTMLSHGFPEHTASVVVEEVSAEQAAGSVQRASPADIHGFGIVASIGIMLLGLLLVAGGIVLFLYLPANPLRFAVHGLTVIGGAIAAAGFKSLLENLW